MATGSIELIHPSSTAKKDSVIARVMVATSLGEWVPTGASLAAVEVAVLTDVLTDDAEAAVEVAEASARDPTMSDEAIDAPPVVDA